MVPSKPSKVYQGVIKSLPGQDKSSMFSCSSLMLWLLFSILRLSCIPIKTSDENLCVCKLIYILFG